MNIVQLTKGGNPMENDASLLQKDSATKETSTADLNHEQRQGITTSSKILDQLFGPTLGIPRNSLIELSGVPGSGKTQLCIKLALNVQLPIEKGGLDGQCIYIDTEGALMIERFYQIAENDNSDEQIQRKLRNIMHYRVLDHMEMIALVHQLPNILRDSPKVKLLIVDSVAYHLRLNIRQNRTRVGLLNFIGQTLAQAAAQFNLAIVVTSHVSTDITIGRLRPALGDSWAQWCTKRLMLTRKRQQRYASIYDPSHRTPYTMEPFTITENGIEDVDDEILARTNQWQESYTQKDVTSSHKADDQDNKPLSWSAIYDSEDIWNEQGGFTDELLSEIPSMLSSIGDGMDDDYEEEEENVYAPLSDRQLPEADDSTTITTSVAPPQPLPYVSQSIRRKQPSLSPDTIPCSSNNISKKARHCEETDTNSTIGDDKDDDDQSGDDWGSEIDESWLAVAELSSPFV